MTNIHAVKPQSALSQSLDTTPSSTEGDSRMKRTLPPKWKYNSSPEKPSKGNDEVKITKLPNIVLKKYESWRDTLSSIGAGGASPFTSLMKISIDIHEMISNNSVDPQIRNILLSIGGAIDSLTAISPQVSASRIPFKFAALVSRPGQPLNTEDLMDLLNDINALKSLAKHDSFSVNYSAPPQHAFMSGKQLTTTQTVIDQRGVAHELPLKWYKKKGAAEEREWKVPLEEYDSVPQRMFVNQGNGIYKSLDSQNHIKLDGRFYPIEFSQGIPDNAFIVSHDAGYSVPVERVIGKNDEWQVVNQRRKGKLDTAKTRIDWEHRIISSATKQYPLDIAVPDSETGLAVIDGNNYIKGVYGFYPVEYNTDIDSYVVKTNSGLDYPVKYDKENSTWKTKILITQPHRYTSNMLKKLGNTFKKPDIKKELIRRNNSSKSDSVKAGQEISIQGGRYIVESDGLVQLRAKNLSKYNKVILTMQDMQNHLVNSMNQISLPLHEQSRHVIAEHFGIAGHEVNSKLVEEIRNNITSLQSALLWLRSSNYSIMSLNDVAVGPAGSDAAYYSSINKIALHDSFFESTRMKRLHILLHESSHARIIDLKQPGLSTPDYFYVKNRTNNESYTQVATGNSKLVHYPDDEGYAFVNAMSATSLDQAWINFANDNSKKIKVLLNNPDSVAGLIMALAGLSNNISGPSRVS